MPCVYDSRGVIMFQNDRVSECVRWWLRDGDDGDWMDGVESIEELAHEMGLA